MSVVAVDAASHFPLQNLPFGVFSSSDDCRKRIGVGIGDHILDLKQVTEAGIFTGPLLSKSTCFEQDVLNQFLSLGPKAWQEARSTVSRLLSLQEGALRDDIALQQRVLRKQNECVLHMPLHVGDYTDFYLSKEHATNCTRIFRGDQTPLQPNWLSLPTAYHGRSSSVVVSGTHIRRPRGQIEVAAGQTAFGECAKLDYELEMGAVVGSGNDLGCPINVNDAEGCIFGMVLLNDWSARDIQKWEYVPLGPFNGKNFATSISPWVVTMDALQPFRCAAVPQISEPLPYLQESDRHSYDIHLTASLQPHKSDTTTTITSTNYKHLYWTLSQMVAHHTSGGCNLRCGDLLGTGTISCQSDQGSGCLLEATWGGTRPLTIGQAQRSFLEDGDVVTLSGYCQADGFRVGFGECSGKVLPALKLDGH